MTETKRKTESCELCVIGLGIAGLNALHGATQYLSKTDKIIVADRKQQAIGGMWNTVYDFVRLHQPHPLFTIGNHKWSLQKDRSYLASSREITHHFGSCFQELKQRFDISEQLGYEYEYHKEVPIESGYEVHVFLRSLADDAPDLLIKAKKCIKAFGFDVRPNIPLTLSTDKVHAIAPESSVLLDGTVAKDDRPVYIIGGGKTSMDVAHLLVSQNPDRKLNFIMGKGTYFLDRSTFFPAGSNRYRKGILLSQFFMDVVRRYDLNRPDEITDYIRSTYCLTPFGEAKHSLFGLLSPEEYDKINGAIDEKTYDNLLDVKEDGDGLSLHLKHGATQPIAPGSWVINCTGHLFSGDDASDPIISEHGQVLAIQKTASSFVFTSFAGYFLPHLWFRNEFSQAPFLFFNHQALAQKNKEAYLVAAIAQVVYNQIRCVESLPLKVVNDCGLNFDKWFPLHRQGMAILQLLSSKKKFLKTSEQIIKSICQQHDVEHGEI